MGARQSRSKQSKAYPTALEQTVELVAMVVSTLRKLVDKYPGACRADTNFDNYLTQEYGSWEQLGVEVDRLCENICDVVTLQPLDDLDLNRYERAMWILYDNIVPLVRGGGVVQRREGVDPAATGWEEALKAERQRRQREREEETQRRIAAKAMNDERQQRWERICNQDKRLDRVGKPVIYLRANGRYEVSITMTQPVTHLVTSPCVGSDLTAKETGHTFSAMGTSSSRSQHSTPIDAAHLVRPSLEQTSAILVEVVRTFQKIVEKYPEAFCDDLSLPKETLNFTSWSALKDAACQLSKRVQLAVVLPNIGGLDLRNYAHAMWVLNDTVIPLATGGGIVDPIRRRRNIAASQPPEWEKDLEAEWTRRDQAWQDADRQRRERIEEERRAEEEAKEEECRRERSCWADSGDYIGKPIIYLRANGHHEVSVSMSQPVFHVVTSPVCLESKTLSNVTIRWEVDASDGGRKLLHKEQDGAVESYSCLFYEMATEYLLYDDNLPQVFVANLFEANKLLRWMLTTAGGFSDEERDSAVTFWLPFLARGGTIVNATSLYDTICPLAAVNLDTHQSLPVKRIFIGIAPNVRTRGAAPLANVLNGEAHFVDAGCCLAESEHALEWGNVIYTSFTAN